MKILSKTNHLLAVLGLSLLLLVAGCVVGCDIPESIQDASASVRQANYVMDQLVEGLADAPEKFEVLLHNSVTGMENLTGKSIENLKAGLDQVLSDAISDLQQTGNCLSVRFSNDLISQVQKLKYEQLIGSAPPPSKEVPVVCYPSPRRVDLNSPRRYRSSIEVFGIDLNLNSAGWEAVLTGSGLSERKLTEPPRVNGGVGDRLTLSLAEASDEVLGDYSSLEIRYLDSTLIFLPIIPKEIAPCQAHEVHIDAKPAKMSFTPPIAKESQKRLYLREPVKWQVKVQFSHDGKRAYARMYVLTSLEHKSSPFHASGWSPWQQYYVAPAGYKISGFVGDRTLTLADYMDHTKADDEIETAAAMAIMSREGKHSGGNPTAEAIFNAGGLPDIHISKVCK